MTQGSFLTLQIEQLNLSIMQETWSDPLGRTYKRRSNILEVIAELKVNTETWVLEKTESAMFKEDMLPPIENQKKTYSFSSLLNFNESRKVKSDLSSFFDKIEEKRE